MGNKRITQAIVSTLSAFQPNMEKEEIRLFNPDGSTYHGGRDVVAAAVTTATAIGTAAKTTTADLPAAGTLIPVVFTNGNSAASITIAFATGGAKTVLLAGAAPASGEVTIAAGGVALFYYDGTSLHQIGVYS